MTLAKDMLFKEVCVMLNAMDNITARIDGNPNFNYMKMELRLIDGEIFIVHYDNFYWSFHQLTDEYIMQQDHKPSRDLAQLIMDNYKDVVSAIWSVENHGEGYTVEISDGFTISRH